MTEAKQPKTPRKRASTAGKAKTAGATSASGGRKRKTPVKAEEDPEDVEAKVEEDVDGTPIKKNRM